VKRKRLPLALDRSIRSAWLPDRRGARNSQSCDAVKRESFSSVWLPKPDSNIRPAG